MILVYIMVIIFCFFIFDFEVSVDLLVFVVSVIILVLKVACYWYFKYVLEWRKWIEEKVSILEIGNISCLGFLIVWENMNKKV